MIGRLVVAVFLIVPLAATATATASTAKVTASCDRYCFYAAEFTAAPGEPNRLEISGTPTQVVFRDSGSTIAAADGCVAADPHEVTCAASTTDRTFRPSPQVLDAVARLGDGNDVATAPRAVKYEATVIDGGPDDDIISVFGRAPTRLIGGPGVDQVNGGPGPDILEDGERSSGASRDVFNGGGGGDLVTYDRRTKRVVVDLRSGHGGQAGESDALIRVEGASTGDGDDLLLGTDGDNDLSPGNGENVVRGRGGDDRISGGRMADRIDAGDGDDRITLTDFRPRGTGDRLRCGSGKDLVDSVGMSDVLRDDCESFALNDSALTDWSVRSPLARIDDPFLIFDGCCTPGFDVVARTRRGDEVGRARVRDPDDRPVRVKVRLSPYGQQRLRRAKTLQIRIGVSEQMVRGRANHRGLTLVLRTR